MLQYAQVQTHNNNFRIIDIGVKLLSIYFKFWILCTQSDQAMPQLQPETGEIKFPVRSWKFSIKETNVPIMEQGGKTFPSKHSGLYVAKCTSTLINGNLRDRKKINIGIIIGFLETITMRLRKFVLLFSLQTNTYPTYEKCRILPLALHNSAMVQVQKIFAIGRNRLPAQFISNIAWIKKPFHLNHDNDSCNYFQIISTGRRKSLSIFSLQS